MRRPETATLSGGCLVGQAAEKIELIPLEEAEIQPPEQIVEYALRITELVAPGPA